MSSKLSFLTLLLASTLLIACGKELEVEIHDPIVEIDPTSDQPAKAYMALQNHAPQAKTLVSVVSERAKSAEFYTKPIASDSSAPIKLEEIKIPAMGRTQLEPNGDYIQLTDLPNNLSAGESITLTLQFEDGTIRSIDARIKSSSQG